MWVKRLILQNGGNCFGRRFFVCLYYWAHYIWIIFFFVIVISLSTEESWVDTTHICFWHNRVVCCSVAVLNLPLSRETCDHRVVVVCCVCVWQPKPAREGRLSLLSVYYCVVQCSRNDPEADWWSMNVCDKRMTGNMIGIGMWDVHNEKKNTRQAGLPLPTRTVCYQEHSKAHGRSTMLKHQE